MYEEILFEIVITAQEGVLPAIAMLNDQRYDKLWKNRPYKLSLDFIHTRLQHKVNNNINELDFDLVNPRDWRKWYEELFRISSETDKLLIEHEHGLYAISDDVYPRQLINEFLDTLTPLCIPRHYCTEKSKYTYPGRTARKQGYKIAASKHNNPRGVINL